MDEGRAMENQEQRGKKLRGRGSRVRLKFQAQRDHGELGVRGWGWAKEFAHQPDAVGDTEEVQAGVVCEEMAVLHNS